MNHYRQGDVFIETASIPSDAKLLPIASRIILAAGEVTGHHHAITADPTVCQAYELDGKLYLRVGAPVDLVHEEHGKITLPAGDYVSWIQREYDPIGTHQVED